MIMNRWTWSLLVSSLNTQISIVTSISYTLPTCKQFFVPYDDICHFYMSSILNPNLYNWDNKSLCWDHSNMHTFTWPSPPLIFKKKNTHRAKTQLQNHTLSSIQSQKQRITNTPISSPDLFSLGHLSIIWRAKTTQNFRVPARGRSCQTWSKWCQSTVLSGCDTLGCVWVWMAVFVVSENEWS